MSQATHRRRRCKSNEQLSVVRCFCAHDVCECLRISASAVQQFAGMTNELANMDEPDELRGVES